MSKEVAKKKSTAVSTENAFAGYMGKDYNDGVDDDSLILPRIKIVQGTTKDKQDTQVGEFLHNLKGSLTNSIEFFILLAWKTRILFSDDNQNIRCRATDGKVSNQGENVGVECAKCKFSKWEGNTKPPCTLIYTYAIVLRKELSEAIKNGTLLPPTTIGFHSTGTKVAKFLNTNIRIGTGQGKPIWAELIKLSTEKKTFDKGDSFVPVAKIGATLNPAENKDICDYLNQLRQAYIKMDLHTQLHESEVIDEVAGEDVDAGKPAPAPEPTEEDDLNI